MLPGGPRYHGLRGSAHFSRKPRREEATPAVPARAPCVLGGAPHPRLASDRARDLPGRSWVANNLHRRPGESAGNFRAARARGGDGCVPTDGGGASVRPCVRVADGGVRSAFATAKLVVVLLKYYSREGIHPSVHPSVLRAAGAALL